MKIIFGLFLLGLVGCTKRFEMPIEKGDLSQVGDEQWVIVGNGQGFSIQSGAIIYLTAITEPIDWDTTIPPKSFYRK